MCYGQRLDCGKKMQRKKRPIAIKKDKAGLTGKGDIEAGQPRRVKELQ